MPIPCKHFALDDSCKLVSLAPVVLDTLAGKRHSGSRLHVLLRPLQWPEFQRIVKIVKARGHTPQVHNF